MKKLAVLHTTPATVGLVMKLAAEELPGVTVYNIMDDSILPTLLEDDKNMDDVFERLLVYARLAEKLGVDLILVACSSVGEFSDYAADKISTPILRIDEAMSEKAAEMGGRIVLAATLRTTLAPSYRLFLKKCEGNNIEIQSRLIPEAYEALKKHNKPEHDRLIAEELKKFLAVFDAVMLTQASMSEAVTLLPAEDQSRILSSPKLAIQKVKDMLSV